VGETSELHAVVAEPESNKPASNLAPSKARAVVTALIATAIFCAALAIWLYFDKHVPACDEANHVLNGLTYTNLLQHARPLRASWWHSFFTVNTYYPPVGTLTMGIACAIIKDPILALQLVKIFWLAVLSLSVGAIAFMVSGSSIGVAAAICLVNLCVITCDFSHYSLIDQPLVAMVATGLAVIYWKGGKASVKHSLVTGLVLGLAIMSKQVAIAFLGFPILFDSMITLRRNWNKNGLQSLFLVALPLIIICLPWTAINFISVQKLNAEIAAELSKRGSPNARILFNLEYYLGSWLYCASPLVLFTALLGFCTVKWEQQKKLFILWISILPTALALCLISCQPARDRYIAPIVILIAVAGSLGTKQIANKNKTVFLIAAVIFLPLGALQYLSFNFNPYPISQPGFFRQAPRWLGCALREHISPFFDKGNSIVFWQHIPPSRDGGELANQILNYIDQVDGQRSSWLNITASSSGLDVHEMELLAKLRKLAVKPTTSRVWTALGDKEEFSESKALDFRWYVIKNGDQGFRFADQRNLLAHEKLIDFVRHHYKLIKQFKSTNDENVELYLAP
jgi:hypothetical protein